MARRATRNAQQTIHRLYVGAFGTQFYNQPVRGRPFDSEEGGRGLLSNFVWTGNLFSAWALSEILFSCKHGKPHAHSPLRQLLVLETVMLFKAVHL